MIKSLDLKEVASVDSSLALVEMEVEGAKREGVSVLKLVHGYGSHGQGGATLKEVRRLLLILKKRGKIKDFFNGDKWNLFQKECVEILTRDKTIVGDCDLNKNNPGITIVVL